MRRTPQLTKHHNFNQIQCDNLCQHFCFQGSGTEFSRQFILIFLEDSDTVLDKTDHIIITLTAHKKKKITKYRIIFNTQLSFLLVLTGSTL